MIEVEQEISGAPAARLASRRSRGSCATASSASRSSSGSSSGCCRGARAARRRPSASPTRTPGGCARDRASSCSPARATWCCSSSSSGGSAAASTSRLSLAELAVNSVVSVSGLAGSRSGAWVLRTQGHLGRADRQALGAHLRAHERGQRRRGGGDRHADVARPAAGLARPAADAAAGAAALATIVGTLALAAWAPAAAAPEADASGRVGGGAERASATAWRTRCADRRARLAAARRGRLLAVRQPRALGLPGGLRPRPLVLGGRDGLPRGDARELDPHPRRLRRRRRRARGDAAAVRRAPRLGGARAVVIYRAISLWMPALIGSAAFLSCAARSASRSRPRRGIAAPGATPMPGASCWSTGSVFRLLRWPAPGALAGVAGERLHRAFDRVPGAVELRAVHRRRQARACRAGRVDGQQLARGRERVGEGVGEEVDRDAARVELDRAAFVVDDRGNAADEDVVLRAERLVGVQAGRSPS